MNTPEYPEKFSFVSIMYKCGCKGFAYAPLYTVNQNETVITDVDEGQITNIVKYCTPEDDWFRAVSSVMAVDKITHKIVEVDEK